MNAHPCSRPPGFRKAHTFFLIDFNCTKISQRNKPNSQRLSRLGKYQQLWAEQLTVMVVHCIPQRDPQVPLTLQALPNLLATGGPIPSRAPTVNFLHPLIQNPDTVRLQQRRTKDATHRAPVVDIVVVFPRPLFPPPHHRQQR